MSHDLSHTGEGSISMIGSRNLRFLGGLCATLLVVLVVVIPLLGLPKWVLAVDLATLFVGTLFLALSGRRQP